MNKKPKKDKYVSFENSVFAEAERAYYEVIGRKYQQIIQASSGRGHHCACDREAEINRLENMFIRSGCYPNATSAALDAYEQNLKNGCYD